jgi:hypothetical protein
MDYMYKIPVNCNIIIEIKWRKKNTVSGKG